MPYTSALAESLAPDLLDRFLRYVRVDTQSRRDRTQSPSTPGQLELARILVGELEAIGLQDVALDENGYVTATLPANGDGRPVIGLLAHLDTSPDAPGADDKPGMAEVMAAVAHLAAHPELPRPTLRVGFTPDEEIGEGATLFDVER